VNQVEPTLPVCAADPRPLVSGFVLAGGQSFRMGSDKAMLPWTDCNGNPGTLLDHAVRRLQRVCATVHVCVAHGGSAQAGSAQSYASSQATPAPFIMDAIPDAGPLAGIVAAMELTRTEWNLFLAIDLPLLPVEFLQSLCGRISMIDCRPTASDLPSTAASVCIVPVLAGRPQPLCSLLHRSLAAGLCQALQRGDYKIMHAFQSAAEQVFGRLNLWDVEGFAVVEIPTGVRPQLRLEEMFLNANTPQQWCEVQRIASR